MSALKKIANILLIVFGIILILTGYVIYKIKDPAFQTKVAKEATDYLSKKLNNQVKIGSVEISFFHSLILNDLLITDLNKDTLLSAGKIEARLKLLSLIKNRYVIDYILLDSSSIFLHRPLDGGDYNFQFIVDAFANSDTTSSTTPSTVKLELNQVKLNQCHFVFLDEFNTTKLNFKFPLLQVNVKKFDLQKEKIELKKILFDHPNLVITKLINTLPDTSSFPYPDTAVVHINTKTLQLFVSSLEFKEASFIYDDENEKEDPSIFDPAHQSFTHLNMDIENGSMINDTIQGRFSNLSATEKCGFVLTHLEGVGKVTPYEASLTNLKIETPNSKINDFFALDYFNFHAFLNLNEDLILNLNLKQSAIDLRDIAYFIPGIKGINEKIIADGTIHGTLNNIKGKNLVLKAGSVTKFEGNVAFKGLPEIDETFIEVDANKIVSSATDIKRFIPHATIPQELYRAGKITFKGNFSGFISDFVAYGNFTSDLGNLNSDLNMKFKNDIQSASYSGNLSTSGFNLGKLIDQDSTFGAIEFAMNVTGNGLSAENVNAKINGTIEKFSFNDYTYQHIKVDGDLTSKIFKGTVVANDENIKLNFAGTVDMSEQLPFYDFTAEIDSANFKQLNFTTDEYIMSGKFDLKMKGNNIDDLLGNINASNILFSKDDVKLPISFLSLDISKQNETSKSLLINSPFGKIAITGDYAITKLPATVFGVVDFYFPALPDYFSATESIEEFDFLIDLKNLDKTVHFFIPSVSSFDSTSIAGHFSSSKHEINFNGKAASCFYQNIYLGEISLASITRNDSLILFAGSKSIHLSDSILITEPHFNAVLNNKTIFLGLHGASPDGRNYVNLISSITGDANQISMHILPSDIILNSRGWHISENNLITYTDERLLFKDFILNNEDRSLKITNVNLRVKATNLQFDFNNIPILDFHELLGLSGMELSGNISGTATVLNIFNSPRISANTTITDFGLNEARIKLVNAEISYIPEDDQIILQFQLVDPTYDVDINGLYYPRRETDQLHLDLNIKKANLLLLQSLFFEGMISNTSGITTGHLVMEGNPDAPLLTGDLMINSLTTTVEYLKTTYRCYNEPVHFSETSIDLGSITLFDESNDSARATGKIFHDHLNDFSMNVSINTKRFMALNTTAKDDSSFYGTAYASGIIQFIGPVDAMEIRATVKSSKGTEMSIPVYSSASLNKNSFIKYVDKSQQLIIAPPQQLKSIEGLTMNLNLEITPDAIIEIIFDEKSGDIIKGSGNGNIKMEIDTKGEFNMYGDFTIEKGNYLFTQLNFLNKYFTVEKGGTIIWTGDPFDAQIDISAIYSTRASLYELVQGTAVLTDDEIKELKQRKKVDLYLKLNGSLFTPEISFDIRLPEETTVSSLANIELLRVKQDEQEMNKQVFGILVLGHFLPQQSGLGEQSIGTEVNNSISEFLSNQVSRLASQVRDDVDFNVNYQSYETTINSADPNSLVKRNELQVELTKRFLNDRLIVDVGGNFDFGGSGGETSQTSSGIAGDFAVEYKITPDGRVSGKVFSESNYDVIDERNKTKNGVALQYTREFDTLKELFKDPEKQKRRDRKKQKQEEKLNSEAIPPEKK